jgi:gamma-glutamyltranspeptidase
MSSSVSVISRFELLGAAAFVLVLSFGCLFFREILINNKTDHVWKEGDKYKRLKLAETLELIRDSDASVLYNGSLTESFVKDIQDLGGIITQEDMNEYE